MAGLEQLSDIEPIREAAATVEAMTLYAGVLEQVRNSGLQVQFGPEIPIASEADEHRYDVIIVLISKSKPLNALLVHYAASLASLASLTETGTELWLVGHNKAGIKSQSGLLTDYCDKVIKTDSARHCVIYSGKANTRTTFQLDDYRQRHSIRTEQTGFDVISYPGVFAHGRLDQGTELLLNTAAMPTHGSLLDFGCGCGVIGAHVSQLSQDSCRIDAVDHDAMALAASRATYALNNVCGEVMASDGLSAVQQRYDVVITNPPFHHGIRTTTDATHRFLDSVRDHLNDSGSLLMVANAHLDYPEWLKRHFRQTEVLARTGTYQVTRSRR